MRSSLLLLLLLVSANAAAVTVYRSVDEHGNTVFSDYPEEGAKEVEVAPTPTYAPPPPRAAPSAPKAGPSSTEPAPRYESVAITAPADEEGLRDNAGNVEVGVQSKPELARTHQFQLLLDGAPTGAPFRGAGVRLTNVDRGTHTVQVQIVDDTDAVVAESSPVTFHLQRHSILFTPPATPPPASGQ